MFPAAPGQVILRWATQRGLAIIPKSSEERWLRENLECNSFELSEHDMKKISALNIGMRVRAIYSLLFLY